MGTKQLGAAAAASADTNKSLKSDKYMYTYRKGDGWGRTEEMRRYTALMTAQREMEEAKKKEKELQRRRRLAAGE